MEFNSEISFRKCLNNEYDMKLIFEWSNDEEVRKNSFSSKKIEFEDHKKWFQSKINAENYHILFFMVNYKEVGLVRLEVEDYKAIISYQISKDYRGLGYGKTMIHLLEKYVLENKLATCLYGEVKKGNVSSQRIFESLDYRKFLEEDKCIYKKTIERRTK